MSQLLRSSINLTYHITDPFEDWYNSLRDTTGKNKIRLRLKRVMTGNLGDCKSVGEGVFELKIDFGPGYRL